MTINQAIQILDPETTWEALGGLRRPEAIDKVEEACRLACDAMRALQDKNPWIRDINKAKVLNGLRDLLKDREAFAQDEDDDIFSQDIQILEQAIALIQSMAPMKEGE